MEYIFNTWKATPKVGRFLLSPLQSTASVGWTQSAPLKKQIAYVEDSPLHDSRDISYSRRLGLEL